MVQVFSTDFWYVYWPFDQLHPLGQLSKAESIWSNHILLMLVQNNVQAAGDSTPMNGFDNVRRSSQSSGRSRTAHNLQSPSFTAGW